MKDQGFLADILANPEDDTPRLVYADWLEERHRSTQAELIRVQCALAQAEGEAGHLRKLESWVGDVGWRVQAKDWVTTCHSLLFTLDPPASPSEVERLRAREKELLQAVEDLLPEEDISVDYYLGLPHALHGAPHQLLAHIDAIAQAFPTLALRLARSGDEEFLGDMEDEEALQDWEDPHPGGTRLLAEHPILERCVDLEVLESLGDEDAFIVLLESPHLRNLRRFVAENCQLRKAVLALLRPEMANLTWLDLSNNRSADGRVGDAELEKLVTCPHLERLEFLSFGSNQVTDEGARVLAGAAGMKRLRRLCLDRTGLGAAGVRALAHSPHLTALDFLDLGNLFPPPGDDLVNALLGSPLLPRLRGLDLRYNGLTDAGLRMLGSSPATNGLRSLGLNANSGRGQVPLTSPGGIRALLSGAGLENLRRLNLWGHPFDDEAARVLAAASFPHVRELVVRGRSLTRQGLALLEERFGQALRVH
jgi:uncharacterized protein (TIGR02996 family)